MPPRIFLTFFFLSILCSDIQSQNPFCPNATIEIMVYADQALVNEFNGDVSAALAYAKSLAVIGIEEVFAVGLNIGDVTVLPSACRVINDPSSNPQIAINNMSAFATNDCHNKSVEMAVLVTGVDLAGANGVSNSKPLERVRSFNDDIAVAIVDYHGPDPVTTMAHEFLHNFIRAADYACPSVGNCDGIEDTRCEPNLAGNIPLLCCSRCGVQTAELLFPEIKTAIENKLQNICDLFQDQEQFSVSANCENCEITTSISSNVPPIINLDCLENGEFEAEYEIEVCNNCHSPKNLDVWFFSPAFQNITFAPDFTQSNANATHLIYKLDNNSFNIDECKTFIIKADILNPPSTSTPAANNIELLLHGPDQLELKNGMSLNFTSSPIFEITGDVFLSDIINNNPFSSNRNCIVHTTGSNVSIDGTLIMDVPYCFVSVNFFMKGNSKIIINERVILPGPSINIVDFVDCNFVPCGDVMWDEILLIPNSGLRMIRTLISGANIGLNIKNNTFLDLNGNEFLNNDIGINIENSIAHINRLRQNTFSAPKLLNGAKGFAGISLKNAGGKTEIKGNNSFSSMQNGVFAENSNFNVDGASFSDFSSTGDNSGIGINARGYSMTVSNNDFLNCETAIRGDRMSATIESNKIEYSLDAIHTLETRFVTIKDNEISATRHGIRAEDNQLLNITRNKKIEVNGNNPAISHAIRVEASNRTLASISNNKGIRALNAQNGIFMEGGAGLIAKRNDVLSTFEEGSGIRTDGINTITLDCNKIVGAGEANQGIRSQDSGGKVECNKTIGSGTGVQFSGGMAGVAFKGNAMVGNDVNGLELTGQDIVIGGQPHHGNVWLETAASHQGVDVDASKFTVHTIDDGFLPNPPDPDFWFLPQPNDSWFTCPDPTCGINIPELPDFPDFPEPDFPEPEDCEEITKTDGEVAAGKYNNAQEGNLWSAQKRLMEKIKLPCTEIPPGFPDINDFEQEHANGVLGKLVDVELSIKNLWNRTEAESIVWETLHIDMDAVLDNWKFFGEQLQDSTLTEDEINAINEQRLIAYSIVEQLQSQIDNSVAEYQQNIQNKILLIEAENNVIETTSIPGENDKIINTIYLNKWKTDSEGVAEAELNTLHAIASQCPQNGGDGVYRARAMYAQHYPDAIFDDTGCEAVEFRRKSTFIEKSIIDFILQPTQQKMK